METQTAPQKAEFEPQAWTWITKNQDYAFAHWNQIFATIWFHETTLDGIRHLYKSVSEFAKSNPKGIALLTLVAAGAGLPSSSARRALSDLLAAGTDYVRCSAVIMEGSGFRAAAVRSVVTGITMLSKHPYPHEICDAERAAQMFGDRLLRATGKAPNTRTLRGAIESLRQSIC